MTAHFLAGCVLLLYILYGAFFSGLSLLMEYFHSVVLLVSNNFHFPHTYQIFSVAWRLDSDSQ